MIAEKILHSFTPFDVGSSRYNVSSRGTGFELNPKAGTGWKQSVLYSFKSNGKDAMHPGAGLIMDGDGSLYGTTEVGGQSKSCWNSESSLCGTVFELTPKAGGGWTEKVLHSFQNNGKDGNYPQAGMALDAAGNFYGTTVSGGAYGVGTVFELTPKAGGGWTEKVLHSFQNDGKDGNTPQADLVFNTKGNLYGTTRFGGTADEGTVFELTLKAGDGWKEKVLYSFQNNGKDGNIPVADLIMDGSGNLYGTTEFGGTDGEGTVFELTPKAGGGWKEKVLHSFNPFGKDGYNPLGNLIFYAGSLYGTTEYGGSGLCNDRGILGCGTVFKLTPNAGGGWTETVLYSFQSEGKDGIYPQAGLVADATGNLYGTTQFGGTADVGTVFELTPKAGGGWTEKVLHSFQNDGKDGNVPVAGLMMDGIGNFYGTTTYGGHNDCGTVFELTPEVGGRTEGP